MCSLGATVPVLAISGEKQLGKTEVKHQGRIQLGGSSLVRSSIRCQSFQGRPVTLNTRTHARNVICAALAARCGAEQGQTQTVLRESSVITVAPVSGKEKSPDLDDGGSDLPPRDDGDGGGGGGGGGGNWSGGFWFFGFLAFLGFLKDQENEGAYRDDRR